MPKLGFQWSAGDELLQPMQALDTRRLQTIKGWEAAQEAGQSMPPPPLPTRKLTTFARSAHIEEQLAYQANCNQVYIWANVSGIGNSVRDRYDTVSYIAT